MNITKKGIALVAVAGAALVLVSGVGGATAAGLIHGSDIAAHTITGHNLAGNSVNKGKLTNGSVGMAELNSDARSFIESQANGTPGPQGDTGPAGPQGATGPAGPSGLDSAYWAVAKYDVGDTNGGAIATVACNNSTDVAIAGGVRTLGLDTDNSNNVPVSSSFPGRMDWTTNTPKPNRLDGWIVQFGGNYNGSPQAPKYVDVFALCVPDSSITTQTTYIESDD